MGPRINIENQAGAYGTLRDWSLITGRGEGATKREWGACEVLPLRKGEAENVLAMLN